MANNYALEDVKIPGNHCDETQTTSETGERYSQRQDTDENPSVMDEGLLCKL